MNAEITVDVAIVSANWRKNWPMIPVMNAQGTNTAVSTRPMAITGPETSSMARIVASRGDMPVLDVVLDRLDDHDRVVDHDPDRQHQAEERQVVEAEADGRHVSRQEWFRGEIALTISRGRLMGRALTWPEGYPGDYITLEGMYSNEPMGEGFARHLDEYSLSSTLAIAVRSRLQHLGRLIALAPIAKGPRGTG